MSDLKSELRDLKDEAKTSGMLMCAKRVIDGWLVLVSYYPVDESWHLSAALEPAGRGSTEADWETLGRIAAAAGAPLEPLVMNKDDPNAPVHWHWRDPPC